VRPWGEIIPLFVVPGEELKKLKYFQTKDMSGPFKEETKATIVIRRG